MFPDSVIGIIRNEIQKQGQYLIITSFRYCHSFFQSGEYSRNLFVTWVWVNQVMSKKTSHFDITVWKDPIFNWTVLLFFHQFSIIFSHLKSWGKYWTAREFHKKNFIQSNMERSKLLPRKIRNWLKHGVMLSLCLNQPLDSHVQ